MNARNRITIPARRGKAVRLDRGAHIKVINTYGSQVVDTWAFCGGNLSEFMSMEHSRSAVEAIFLRKGDSAVTNRYRPILTMVEDTSHGTHDTLLAACSPGLYQSFGVQDHHASCTENLSTALGEISLSPPGIPCPWNLFQKTPVDGQGRLSFPESEVERGCFVVLRAELDCVLAFSACPWDLPGSPINGPDGNTSDCHFEVY